MMESAGRVAVGLFGHTLFSPRYFEDVRCCRRSSVGRRKVGRDPAGHRLCAAMVLASGLPTIEEAAGVREGAPPMDRLLRLR
jgi:hypothetical protein